MTKRTKWLSVRVGDLEADVGRMKPKLSDTYLDAMNTRVKADSLTLRVVELEREVPRLRREVATLHAQLLSHDDTVQVQYPDGHVHLLPRLCVIRGKDFQGQTIHEVRHPDRMAVTYVVTDPRAATEDVSS